MINHQQYKLYTYNLNRKTKRIRIFKMKHKKNYTDNIKKNYIDNITNSPNKTIILKKKEQETQKKKKLHITLK
jgi:hypothetical protein